MLHIALFEPEIAANTGNIARTCAATGVRLHLIGRLGFRLDDRSLRRAGVDYWEEVDHVRHSGWDSFTRAMSHTRLWFFAARQGAPFTAVRYQDQDCLVFGGESNGLPRWLLEQHAGKVLHIPMPTGKVRSLNQAAAAGIALYEVLRQVHGW
jgi:tRNA (cytidine/uridine-2'-O-)-methyltransferase